MKFKLLEYLLIMKSHFTRIININEINSKLLSFEEGLRITSCLYNPSTRGVVGTFMGREYPAFMVLL